MDDRGQYSTLELANQHPPNRPHEYAQGLEAVPLANYPQVVESQNLPEPAVKSEGPIFVEDPVPPYDGERRICGLKRKAFIIIAALVALLVVGAAVGGGVGATVGKSKSTSTAASPVTTTIGPAPSSTPTSNSTILSNSSLASTNWTDAKGYSHHAVFYQHKSNSLSVSLWDSQNNTWSVKNVSASLNSTFAAPPGTPLACAVSAPPYFFQLNLYYLSPLNQILELYTADPQGGSWSVGNLSTNNLVAGAGSSLASYWNRCDSYLCSQQIILLYEDSSQKVVLANSSDWKRNTYSPFNTPINPGSGLALVPLAPLSDPNTQPYQMRAYFDVSQASKEMMWLGDEGDGWVDGGLPNLPLTSTPPQFAATAFGSPSQGMYSLMVVFLFSNGSISANWFDNTNWHTYIQPSPSMPQGNFSAIAMNLDLRFYGLSAGTVHEYSIDCSKPFD